MFIKNHMLQQIVRKKRLFFIWRSFQTFGYGKISQKGLWLSTLLFIAVACHIPKADERVDLDVDALREEVVLLRLSHDLVTSDSLLVKLEQYTRTTQNRELYLHVKLDQANNAYASGNNEKLRLIIDEIAPVIESNGTVDHKIRLYMVYLYVQLAQADIPGAKEYLNQIGGLLHQANDLRLITKCYLIKMQMHDLNNIPEGLRLGYQALEYAQKSGVMYLKAGVRLSMGVVYFHMGDYESASHQFYLAREVFVQINGWMQIAQIEGSLSAVYYRIKDYERSVLYGKRALEIAERMELINHLPHFNYNLAASLLELNNYPEAKKHLKKATEYLLLYPTIREFDTQRMYVARGYAVLFLDTGRHEEAKEYLQTYKSMAYSLESLNEKVRAQELFHRYYSETGQYQKAYIEMQKGSEYKTLLSNRNRNREVEEIMVKYQVDLQDAKKDVLLQELAYSTAVSEGRKFQQLFLVGVFFFGFLLFLYILWNKRCLEGTLQLLRTTNRLIITKNKELEYVHNNLVRSNREKSALVNTIVHDLKNPLFGLTSFMAITQEQDMDEETQSLTEVARRSTDRLGALVDRLLEVRSLDNNGEQPKIQIVAVHTLGSEVISLFKNKAREKNIHLKAHFETIHVESCPEYIMRILDNLISNAIKFSNPGTTVEVTAGRKRDENWFFQIKDQGPGFSEKDQKKVFQMFSRLSARPTAGETSTGLGLYAVKMLVDRLGGTLSLESSLGEGSCFICRFPVFHQKSVSNILSHS
ncbi:tetratricopeptide repeat-containing sensor histidine kinase [Balneolaceae bacterium ANBcel3]|nr:tetratricopeptide repeat-containing sensor histidine kinase [Balneolaceae bacterium ANBcel3]